MFFVDLPFIIKKKFMILNIFTFYIKFNSKIDSKKIKF